MAVLLTHKTLVYELESVMFIIECNSIHLGTIEFALNRVELRFCSSESMRL